MKVFEGKKGGIVLNPKMKNMLTNSKGESIIVLGTDDGSLLFPVKASEAEERISDAQLIPETDERYIAMKEKLGL